MESAALYILAAVYILIFQLVLVEVYIFKKVYEYYTNLGRRIDKLEDSARYTVISRKDEEKRFKK